MGGAQASGLMQYEVMHYKKFYSTNYLLQRDSQSYANHNPDLLIFHPLNLRLVSVNNTHPMYRRKITLPVSKSIR
jgi:hypothetical protein